MAVYTHISAEDMSAFLTRYDHGHLVNFKGIAEGVENSNYMVETTDGRYILTIYEKRVNVDDLPFFMDLLDHLADRHCPVPRTIKDRQGQHIQELNDKTACLIEFLDGISLSKPNEKQAYSAGAALAQIHVASKDFDGQRANSMGLAGWEKMIQQCDGQWQKIPYGIQLAEHVREEYQWLKDNWPRNLPIGIIHADLFPDNVLMQGNNTSGMIDFYFSCVDISAYDLAIMHSAWCFDYENTTFRPTLSDALLSGYRSILPQSDAEIAAMPILARGSALRFTLSRAYDWINTPADALVTRKDPHEFGKRLNFYQNPDNHHIFS